MASDTLHPLLFDPFGTVLKLRWADLAQAEAQWDRFYQILEALGRARPVLGNLTGWVSTTLLDGADPLDTFEDRNVVYWPMSLASEWVAYDVHDLADRVAEAAVYCRPRPNLAELNAAPILLLPEGVDSISMYETFNGGTEVAQLTLAEAVGTPAPSGYRAWYVRAAPNCHAPGGSLLRFDFGFRLGDGHGEIQLDVISTSDLWTLRTAIGEPAGVHATVNHDNVAETLSHVAAVTGGSVDEVDA